MCFISISPEKTKQNETKQLRRKVYAESSLGVWELALRILSWGSFLFPLQSQDANDGWSLDISPCHVGSHMPVNTFINSPSLNSLQLTF